MLKILKFKAAYYFYRFVRILVKNVFSIFSTFPAMLWIVGYYLLYDKEGALGVFNAFLSGLSDLKVFVLAFLIWVIWNFISALFITFGRDTGRWFGNRFIFDTPIHIFTTLVGPDDDEKLIDYKIPDVQNGVLVGIKMECYGGTAKVALPFIRPISAVSKREMQGSFRLSKAGKSKIAISCPADSDPTIVRVYMVYWEV